MEVSHNHCLHKVGKAMNNQELCILLDSILALLETDNTEKAKEVIRNGIKRIEKGMTSSSDQNNGVARE